MKKDVKELYNDQAEEWARKEPILLSDYSARPFVLDLCEPISGSRILDAGCGEGYVGRQLLKRGAKEVHGIDISEKMIEQANIICHQEELEGLTYEIIDIRNAQFTNERPYDLVLGMFLFNYLNVEDTHSVMKKIYSVLKPGGHFVFSVPHPFLAYLKKDKYPFYFAASHGYFSGRDILFPGEIWRRDGISVGVQCVHKTIEDYFTGLKRAGFNSFPDMHELHITDEHVKLDPEFFTPLIDLPLHIAFKVRKNP
jgi:2-polyprenyl-3-methyl-5-hydroxy-6-metoxy-1,4-benzoquinol methylase